MDDKTKIITEVAVTTAKTFDGHIDLANPDEVVYRDKCYSGIKTKAIGNASMKRGKLTPHEKLRNRRISRKRCRGGASLWDNAQKFQGRKNKIDNTCKGFRSECVYLHGLQCA